MFLTVKLTDKDANQFLRQTLKVTILLCSGMLSKNKSLVLDKKKKSHCNMLAYIAYLFSFHKPVETNIML